MWIEDQRDCLGPRVRRGNIVQLHGPRKSAASKRPDGAYVHAYSVGICKAATCGVPRSDSAENIESVLRTSRELGSPFNVRTVSSPSETGRGREEWYRREICSDEPLIPRRLVNTMSPACSRTVRPGRCRCTRLRGILRVRADPSRSRQAAQMSQSQGESTRSLKRKGLYILSTPGRGSELET